MFRAMMMAALGALLTLSAAHAQAPGETFRDCAECPEMKSLPAGVFMMGAVRSVWGSPDQEGPIHSVAISAFAMGVYEVTWDEWGADAVDHGGPQLR